nr:hypothetical protein [Pandoravirus massiliensis]
MCELATNREDPKQGPHGGSGGRRCRPPVQRRHSLRPFLALFRHGTTEMSKKKERGNEKKRTKGMSAAPRHRVSGGWARRDGCLCRGACRLAAQTARTAPRWSLFCWFLERLFFFSEEINQK